jgi:hypothetical protein
VTDKERFDALFKFWEASWKRITERRQYEWKVTLAVWAALGSFSFALAFQKIVLQPPLEVRCGLVALFLVVSLAIAANYFLFLKGVGKRHDFDRELARVVLSEIALISTLSFPSDYLKKVDMSLPACPPALDWSRRVQFTVAVGLVTLGLVLLVVRLWGSATSLRPTLCWWCL